MVVRRKIVHLLKIVLAGKKRYFQNLSSLLIVVLLPKSLLNIKPVSTNFENKRIRKRVKYPILIIYLAMIFTNAFSQSLKEMENDLISWEITDTYSCKRELANRILQIDPFNYFGIDHLCRYYSDNNIDSVSFFFDNLMKRFPDKTLQLLVE